MPTSFSEDLKLFNVFYQHYPESGIEPVNARHKRVREVSPGAFKLHMQITLYIELSSAVSGGGNIGLDDRNMAPGEAL